MRKTWPGGPNSRTRTHGEDHIKESTKGGRRPKAARPPLWRRPKGASFIWAFPWVRVRAFGPPGQVLLIFITLMCHFAYGFPLGYGRGFVELPLTTILGLSIHVRIPQGKTPYLSPTVPVEIISETARTQSICFSRERRAKGSCCVRLPPGPSCPSRGGCGRKTVL